MSVQQLLVSGLARFGLWAVIGAMTVFGVAASVSLTYLYVHLLGIDLSLALWLLPVLCPAIITPVLCGLVLHLVQKLHRTEEQLRSLNNADPLTGAYNRRFFMERLQREVRRFQVAGTPYAVALIDVDDFKRINDTYGHFGGDEVLKNLAQLCTANVRQTDVFARFGGEEFAVLLPNTGRDNALCFLERLRLQVAECSVEFERRPICVTVSVGLAAACDRSADAQAMLMAADRALYAAKHQGKNRVVGSASTQDPAPEDCAPYALR
jgi:diguanylate cyclase (GGDEF)-like protein